MRIPDVGGRNVSRLASAKDEQAIAAAMAGRIAAPLAHVGVEQDEVFLFGWRHRISGRSADWTSLAAPSTATVVQPLPETELRV
jgi:hypothetical protein